MPRRKKDVITTLALPAEEQMIKKHKSHSVQSSSLERHQELERLAGMTVEQIQKVRTNPKSTAYRRVSASLILKALGPIETVDPDLRAVDILYNRLLGKPLEQRHITGAVDHVVGWGDVMKMLESGGPATNPNHEVIDVVEIRPEPLMEKSSETVEPALELEPEPKPYKKEKLGGPKIEILEGGDDTKPPNPTDIYRSFKRGYGT